MDQLNSNEVRVLGSLIEKAITTPEYYPLTLNALVNACNQKSNRNPVVNFNEDTVLKALYGLRDKKLAWECTTAGSRVSKYQHRFQDIYTVSEPELAVLTVLMLRGPQTPGEIRGRSARLYEFSSIDDVVGTLNDLVNREESSFIVQLPRQPGRKEHRFAHLLTGEVEDDTEPDYSKPKLPTLSVAEETQRLIKLEESVEELRRELEEIKEKFTDFIKQFE